MFYLAYCKRSKILSKIQCYFETRKVNTEINLQEKVYQWKDTEMHLIDIVWLWQETAVKQTASKFNGLEKYQ